MSSVIMIKHIVHTNVILLFSISCQYVLVLCNAIGTPLDSKYIDIGMLTLRLNSFTIKLMANIYVRQNIYNRTKGWVTPQLSPITAALLYMSRYRYVYSIGIKYGNTKNV